MSRIGKLPIRGSRRRDRARSMTDNVVTVKGPKGELTQKVQQGYEDRTRKAARSSSPVPSTTSTTRALHGLYRALIHNMVVGVTKGFEKVLDDGRRRLPRAARTARS